MKTVHIHLELQRVGDGVPQGWKHPEGPDGWQNYCFRYVDIEGNSRETTVLKAEDFHPQQQYHSCEITLHLKPKHGLTAKFCWLNARSFANGYATKGQRLSMVSWANDQISFQLDQKLNPEGNDAGANIIDLDVWVGGLSEHLGEQELHLNCDPKIEIQQ